MPRKSPTQPALSVVSPETTGGAPPRDLGQHGRKLWNEVQAAYGILDRGGNAVDAGVAAGLCLGVLYPDMVSVAGVAPIIFYHADRQEVTRGPRSASTPTRRGSRLIP